MIAFVLASQSKAQEGFSIEPTFGPAVGDAQEFHSFSLNVNFFFLWQVSEKIALGPASGALVFVGEGNSDGSDFLEAIPEVYLPIAIASRVALSKSFATGIDLGYGLNLAGGEGFYFRPMVVSFLKERLGLVGSYYHIAADEYPVSSVNLGFSIGF